MKVKDLIAQLKRFDGNSHLVVRHGKHYYEMSGSDLVEVNVWGGKILKESEVEDMSKKRYLETLCVSLETDY